MKPTLVILAAGLGSRYQGRKQTDAFGPNGEQLLDYTVYDAVKAGFGKIVFVIRKDFANEFEPAIRKKLNGIIAFDFSYQELDSLPSGCDPVKNRTKPWGTGHALWVTKNQVDTPFCMVNADDFYGYNALNDMRELLQSFDVGTLNGGMIGYPLYRTLSEHGSVSRGVCDIEEGVLKGITEHTKITKTEKGALSEMEGKELELPESTTVSMNLMGFTTPVYPLIEDEFRAFYEKHHEEEKSEYYAPNVLQSLIAKGIKIPIRKTDSEWFGVTYPDDKPLVQERLKTLIQEGEYPESLWG